MGLLASAKRPRQNVLVKTRVLVSPRQLLSPAAAGHVDPSSTPCFPSIPTYLHTHILTYLLAYVAPMLPKHRAPPFKVPRVQGLGSRPRALSGPCPSEHLYEPLVDLLTATYLLRLTYLLT